MRNIHLNKTLSSHKLNNILKNFNKKFYLTEKNLKQKINKKNNNQIIELIKNI